jgi:HEAT repeat protein
MKLILPALFLLLLAGCRPSRPALAGGKPVAYWLQAMQAHDPRIRRTAVTRLGNVGGADPAAIAAVIAALNDRDPRVRREAILAVLRSPAKARKTAPALRQLRDNDPESQVRSAAAAALECIEGPAK